MRKQRRQSGQTRWTRNREKEKYWKKQLELWQKSGLSVRAFCKEHGVVETSFYAWRRELIIRAREKGDTAAGGKTTPNSVKDGRGRTIRVCFRQSDHQALESELRDQEATQIESPFVPLSVVPDKQGDVPKASSQRPNSSSGLTITTPLGYRICVSAGDDLTLLRQTLTILEEAKTC